MDSTSLERKCLDLANNLILRCTVDSNRVYNVRSINSEMIVLLFESITKHNIPDLLVHENKEAEAHNVQAVIDTLSLDILEISLSHITGEDVVAGNLVSIYNLLEVLEGLASYMKSKKQVHHRNQNRIVKRKMGRKQKSSSSTSVKSVKSSLKDSPDVGEIIQNENDVTGVSSSTSLASSLKDLKDHSSVLSKSGTKHTISKSNGSRVSLSTSEIPSTPDYPNSMTTTESPPMKLTAHSDKESTAFRSQLHGEEVDLDSIFDQQIQDPEASGKKNDNSQLHFQVDQASRERKNAPNTEKPVFAARNIKRKISKLPREEKIGQSSKNPQEVEELYEENLENRVRVLLEKNSYHRTRASHMKNIHLQNVRRPYKMIPLSSCKKSFLLPHTLRRKSVTSTALKRKISSKSQPRKHVEKPISKKQNILGQDDKKLSESPKEGFMQELFDEFPGLQLSPSIINHIRKKYQQHLIKMHRQVKDILLKKPKTQVQAEEVAKRQSLLSNILKKDIQQQQHLNELREFKKFENKIKYRLRDARLQSAKMKQYCDEFQTEMRKKMQKRNFAEELVLENLFKESLKMQKEQVDYLCQEVKETGENDAKQHLVYLDALENLYHTQFSMLSESFAAEKRDAQDRAKAEQQEMRVIQRDFQEELKHEIRFMQKVIVDCMEDVHFRELDAEQFKMKLRKKLS